MIIALISYVTKWESLTTKIVKRRKMKFGMIDSSTMIVDLWIRLKFIIKVSFFCLVGGTYKSKVFLYFTNLYLLYFKWDHQPLCNVKETEKNCYLTTWFRELSLIRIDLKEKTVT